MRILVTGAAGYIGSMLVGELLGPHCVVAIDNFYYGNMQSLNHLLGESNFEFHKLDVRDTAAVSRLAANCDVIIPLAALVGAPLCEYVPRLAYEVNQKAIEDLVSQLSPNQSIWFPTTNSGYGTTDGEHEVTEDEPLQPISVYGQTKCAAERAVLDHPRGKSFRLATVFGTSPRMRFDLMVNDFVAQLSLKRQLAIFEPHYVRNFVHVRDVCHLFHYNTLRHLPAKTYNVGLPEANLTKLELAHLICDELNLSRDCVTVKNGKDPDQRNYRVSNQRLLHSGFMFMHSLSDGVREVWQMCNWLQPEDITAMRNL